VSGQFSRIEKEVFDRSKTIGNRTHHGCLNGRDRGDLMATRVTSGRSLWRSPNHAPAPASGQFPRTRRINLLGMRECVMLRQRPEARELDERAKVPR